MVECRHKETEANDLSVKKEDQIMKGYYTANG